MTRTGEITGTRSKISLHPGSDRARPNILNLLRKLPQATLSYLLHAYSLLDSKQNATRKCYVEPRVMVLCARPQLGRGAYCCLALVLLLAAFWSVGAVMRREWQVVEESRDCRKVLAAVRRCWIIWHD